MCKIFVFVAAMVVSTLYSANVAHACSCFVNPDYSISDAITDKTVVFRGKPIYFSQKNKPGSSYGWSAVFEIDELFKGDIGNYGNYAKIYHHRWFDEVFQIGDSYFIVAQKQENGDLIKGSTGCCRPAYDEEDIIEYIKTGNPDNALNQHCKDDIRQAIKVEEIFGKFRLTDDGCLKFVSAYKRKYNKGK